MVAVTYDVARVPATKTVPKAAGVETAAPHKSWFAHFMDALMEARMQQARREIAKHAHLLPYTLDERGNRIIRARPEDMPFGGW